MEGSTEFYSPPSAVVKKADNILGLDIKPEPEDHYSPVLLSSSVQKVPSISDLSEADSGVDTSGHGTHHAPHLGSSVPVPLTPGSNKNFGDVLNSFDDIVRMYMFKKNVVSFEVEYI